MEKLTILKRYSEKEKMSQNVPSLKSERTDYRRLHGEILNSILQLWGTNKRFPTDGEVADHLQISRKTVLRHKPDINFRMYAPLLKTLTPRIMERYAGKVLTNPTAKDVELWLKVVEGVK